MGINAGWIGTQGKPKQDVLKALGLIDTGKGIGMFEMFEPAFAGAELAGGWYLVIDGKTQLIENRPVLAKVSAGARTLVGAMLEGSSLSYATEWKDGRQVWSLMHDGSSNPVEHLVAEGALPRGYPEIRDGWLAKQRAAKGVDYVFEIPLETGKTILPFRPDEMPVFFGPKFTVLQRA